MLLYPVRVKYYINVHFTHSCVLKMRVKESVQSIELVFSIPSSVKVIETFVTRLWRERKVTIRMTMKVKTMAQVEFFIWVQ